MHSWSYGIRLGKKASGAWANYVSDVVQPKLPPVLRKINWRELVQISQAPNQLGLPTSLNTDSKLGWSVYSYMSPEILFESCEGSKSILLRIEGYCSKGHDAGREFLAQRAKVGLCPCCAVATHVLVPPVYLVGGPDRKKYNSTTFWPRHGPLARRGYTAAVCFNANGELPVSWDWVAAKRILALPYPLNEADCRTGVSREDHEDTASLARGEKRFPKPPPPVHSNVASPGPSLAKSQGTSKGPPSQGSASWEGGWNKQPWERNNRRWRPGKY